MFASIFLYFFINAYVLQIWYCQHFWGKIVLPKFCLCKKYDFVPVRCKYDAITQPRS